MAFAKFKEGKVFYKVAGKGRTVVLLHGFLESSYIWDDFFIALQKKYQVVLIDLPGHGQSDCFGYVHSMDLMADTVATVLRKLKLRKVFIAGHSMGGYVAVALAKTRPQLFKGLCLFHSSVYADTQERKNLRSRAIEVVKRNQAHYIRESIPNLFAKEFVANYPAKITRVKHEALKTNKQGIVAAIEGMKNREDSSIILKQNMFPLFYIVGKKDNSIPYEISLKQIENIPEQNRLVLENVAHMGFVESPERCLAAIIEFSRISFSKKSLNINSSQT